MALRINTNVSAMSAHKNMIKNDNSLSASLEKLSSGLRINKAADDASGMAIADSLRSQGLGLGQAVRNANDGISMVQTADGALEESINIVNTIKTKAIQSAQDGQTTESRKAIQSDINKLMEELDNIAKTTSFNGQKLLSGSFTNKKFQVGAYSGETVNISIGSAEATKIGHVSASNLTFAGEGTAQLSLYSNLQNQTYTLNAIDIKYNNSRENSLGAVADAINKLSDVLGISAKANVSSTTSSNVAAGTTDSSFAINGVNIGAVTVAENDSTGKLVAAINNKSDQHGVYASVDSAGKLTLTANDGRAINVTQDGNTTAVLGNTASMSTMGKIQVTQTGSGEIMISDKNAVAGVTVSTADGFLKVSGVLSASTAVSSVVAGSEFASGTSFGSGTVLQGEFKATVASVAATADSVTKVTAGSVLASGSVVGANTVLTGAITLNAASITTGSSVTGSGLTTKLTAGTYLAANSIIACGAVFDGDVTAFLSGTAAGQVEYKDGKTTVTVADALVLAGGLTLSAGATLASGSALISGSVVAVGSSLDVDATVRGTMTLASDMVMNKTSSVAVDSILKAGTVFGDSVSTEKGTATADMTLTVGTTLAATSLLANGSTFSTAAGTGGTGVLALSEDETVGPKKMVLAKGTTIIDGSILAKGTVLTVDITEQSGALFKAGTTLTRDIIVCGAIATTQDMTIASGSLLKKGTLLGDGRAAKSDNVESTSTDAKSYRLSDVDVTTQDGAQIGITVADAALKSLDKVRSDLGSVQNQLTSTIANLSVTKVNTFAAESSIRDVDFAEEASNFSKMQILNQAGAFAMAQANASSKNVLSLLQG